MVSIARRLVRREFHPLTAFSSHDPFPTPHEATSPTDTRTREQRRTDLLTTMISGTPAAHGDPADTDLTTTSTGPASPSSSSGSGGVGVHVPVTIPADTFTGGPTPGEVPGYGPLPAATARDLAARATSCQGLVYHPDTGHLLGRSTLLPSGLPGTPAAVAAGATGSGLQLLATWSAVMRWQCAGSPASHPARATRTHRSWNDS